MSGLIDDHPVFSFLLGVGDLDGVYFGDPHPNMRGAFWWRRELRQALIAIDPAAEIARLTAENEGLRDLKDSEFLKLDIGDAIREERNPGADEYAKAFNDGLTLARRVAFIVIDRAASRWMGE